MKAAVCFFFGALLATLGLLVAPEGLRDFRRFALMNEANVQVPAEVVRIQTLQVPRDIHRSSAGGPHDTVEDATLRYAVEGTTYTCVARLYLPLGQTKAGDRLGVHYVATDPGRCYLPNAVVGSWVMSVLLPVLLVGLGAALVYAGLAFRRQGPH
ncbi:MAG: DUF3592 domain-containing protein [Vicinamibacteria bacterium]